jgi:hypothetical protein
MDLAAYREKRIKSKLKFTWSLFSTRRIVFGLISASTFLLITWAMYQKYWFWFNSKVWERIPS